MDNLELRKAGLKVTVPRLKILQLLENAKSHHMSVEDVYSALLESGDDVGLATVYRVLTQFEAAGLVKRLNFEDGYSVFELNQGIHHDHLVCVKCGHIEEFIDEIIEERQQCIALDAGFKMTDHSLNIFGVCGECNQG